MRIIHFSCVAPPEVGGIGKIAAAETCSLRERGHDAHLVSLTTHAGFRLGHAGSVHALPHLVSGSDVVHLHYPFFGMAGTLANFRRKGKIKKLTMTLHMDASAGGFKGFFFSAHRRIFQSGILSAADVLIVSSYDYAENSSFKEFATRAVELPFGVDEKIFLPGEAQHGQFGLDEGRTTLLFVGGMDKPHAFKGVDVLIRALARTEGINLLLVGDGELRKGYEALASELGVTERCRFAGILKNEKLVNAYRTADALVLPSVSGAEAFGLAALEAQSCGKPAICSALPGVRTVVADGETGWLVRPNDPAALASVLNRVARDPDIAKRIGEKARQRVLEKFTWQVHMDGLEKIYADLCASSS